MAAPMGTHVKLAVVGFLSLSAIIVALSFYEWHRRRKKNQGTYEDITEGPNPSPVPTFTNIGLERPEPQTVSEPDGRVAADAAHLMTPSEAKVLTAALLPAAGDEAQLESVLVTLANGAAFTHNQNLLRETGCLERLCELLRTQEMAVKGDNRVSQPRVLNGVITAVNNLAVNEQNQQILQECIPELMSVAQHEAVSEAARLAALQALTNLSTLPTHHAPYTQIIQYLYQVLDHPERRVQLQALRVLVNLSVNPHMVPHLLAAKAPAGLPDLLKPSQDDELLTRLTAVLSNIANTTRSLRLDASSLPTDYKAPSPETMYTALYGVGTNAQIRSRVFVLTKHTNAEIRQKATVIYGALQGV